MATVDASTIQDLIDTGESETVEFKSRWPGGPVVAKVLAAFANTSGGVLIFGVDGHGETVGVEHAQVRDILAKVAHICSSLRLAGPTTGVTSIHGKEVVFVGVSKAPSHLAPVVVSTGQVPRRVGTRITLERQQQRRRCFVSSRAGDDVRTLLATLARQGYDTVVPEQLAPGASWPMLLRQVPNETDLFVAVVPGEPAENVFFEIGMAAALEKRIAGAYERAGYPEVVLTPRSGDAGRDIIATKPGV